MIGPYEGTPCAGIGIPHFPNDECQGVLLIEATRSGHRLAVPEDSIIVEGRVLEAGSLAPLPGVLIEVVGRERRLFTDPEGRFVAEGLLREDRLAFRLLHYYLPDTLDVNRLPGPRAIFDPHAAD